MPKRSIRFFLIALLLLTAGTAGAADCPDDAKTKAAVLLDQAESRFKQAYTEASFKEALAKAREATDVCPAMETAWSFQSQMCWMIGEFLPKSAKKERLVWYHKGEEAADRALSINADSIGGRFWKASNMAGQGDAKGWVTSLGMFPKLLKHMDRVDQLDPHYLYGATDRFWCEVLNRVPLSLADKFGYKVENVIADLEAEIQNEPRFFANYVYAARILWKAGKKEKAVEYLEHVMKTDPAVFPEEKADNAFHKQLAAGLLKEYQSEK